METRKHIGGDSSLRQDAADGRDAAEIPLAGVFAVHGLEHAVASALHGEMDMARYVGISGHHLQRLVAHILGVGGGEAYAHVGGGLRHHPQERREINAFSSGARLVTPHAVVGGGLKGI